MSTYESMKKLELAAACELLRKKIETVESYKKDSMIITKKSKTLYTVNRTRATQKIGGIL